MSTFVLVHGAWHGGWAWDRVAPLLRAAGHDVLAPTLTGVSDRAHLLTRDTGLYTHIEDVTALIVAHDATDVVLVGHSYAGQVISGVADRVAPRLRRRVYLDAFVGDNGEAAIDLLPDTVAHHYRTSVTDAGFDWLIPTRPLERLGITDPRDVEWLAPRLTPHPWLTYTQPLQLTGALNATPASFIECVDWMRVFTAHAQRAAAHGWPVHELPTGHEAMVTAPAALSELLLAHAND